MAQAALALERDWRTTAAHEATRETLAQVVPLRPPAPDPDDGVHRLGELLQFPRRGAFQVFAAIARVGSVYKGDTGGVAASTVAATWGATTTAGNLLVAIVQVQAKGTNLPTITGPAGWASAPPTRAGAAGGNNQDPSCQIFYLKNCGARSGSESFTLSTGAEAIVYLAEYSGADTIAPYDVEGGGSTGASTSSSSSVSAAASIAQANSLVIVGIAAKNQLRSFSAPTNSFSLVRQDSTTDATNSNGIAASFLELIGGTAGSTPSTSVMLNTASQNTGVLAVFKPATAGTLFSRTASDTVTSMTGDAIAMKATRVLTDTTVSPEDSLVVKPGRRAADTIVSPGDSLVVRASRIVTDTAVAFTDALVRLAVRMMADTAASTSGDTVTVKPTRAVSDTLVSAGDSVTVRITRLLTDTLVTAGDALVVGRGFARTATDTIVTASDTLAVAARRAVTDTVCAVADSIVRLVRRLLTDTAVSPDDSLTVVRTRTVSTSDVLVATGDSLARRLTAARTATDTLVVLVDSLQATAILTMQPARLRLVASAATRLDVTSRVSTTLTVGDRAGTGLTVTASPTL